MFTRVPNQYAVLSKGGVFIQAPLFVLETKLYAQVREGFIQLYSNKRTSVQKYLLQHVTIPTAYMGMTETGVLTFNGDADNATS